MYVSFSELLKRHVDRLGLPVSRVSSQSGLAKQTLFNWCSGVKPRWHPKLPDELERLARVLGLGPSESEELLLAAGCACAVEGLHGEVGTVGSFALPKGWVRAGHQATQYEMGLDPSAVHEGHKCVTIVARGARTDGFGTLMQSSRPGELLGRRARFSAAARAVDVAGWAGLWLRVDGTERREPLAFDNMQDRPLKGTTDWTRHSVVLDVPERATGLAYGILLCGPGRVWMADVRIEAVGSEVPSTNLGLYPLPERPVNLDFSE